MIRAAALGSVAVRHAPVNAQRRIKGADGLARFRGIDAQSLARFDLGSRGVKHGIPVGRGVESSVQFRSGACRAPGGRHTAHPGPSVAAAAGGGQDFVSPFFGTASVVSHN